MATQDSTKNKAYVERFNELATGGFIGDPTGELSFGYCRVSSLAQINDDRDGLPRQIEYIHEVGLRDHLKISLDTIFLDAGFSGLDSDRPSLNKLLHEITQSTRRSEHIIIESIDRLSRNFDDMVQFQLLAEFKHWQISIHWHKDHGNTLMLSASGFSANEQIKLSVERIKAARKSKAKKGNVVSSYAPYGYITVFDCDANGQFIKSTGHYVIDPIQAEIVREIFNRYVGGYSMREIANDFDRRGIPVGTRSKFWAQTTIRTILKNTVYKGDFAYNRYKVNKNVLKKDQHTGSFKRVKKERVENPPEEWIIVPVDPIVPVEIWEQANAQLAKNRENTGRSPRKFLLRRKVFCSFCGKLFSGRTNDVGYLTYGCTSDKMNKAARKELGCTQGSISVKKLDESVWSAILQELVNPQKMIQALDEKQKTSKDQSIKRAIANLQKELSAKSKEDEKLYKAYMAEVFDEREYKLKREVLKNDISGIESAIEKQKTALNTVPDYAAQKALILSVSEQINAIDVSVEPTFETKQRLIQALVDRIVLDVQKQQFTIEGAINGDFLISPNTSCSWSTTHRVGWQPYSNV